jgi:HD-like signal output (HDOD) protein
MIERPLPSLNAYVEYLTGADLPVLRHTKRQLIEAQAASDRVTARQLSQIVLQDPLMAVKVLYYIQPFRGKSLRSDITTVGGAIMMLGIEPFFNKFAELVTVEDRLADQPEALLGAIRTIRRVQRAAHWAHDWALWRHDLNAEEVTMATLLHDLAEILSWCFAPRLAIEMQRRQRADRSLRSAAVQQDVFGITIHELQLALNRAWHLPELLQRLTDDGQVDLRRVRNVVLAINLARHAANGWNDAALPDDFRAIAELLNISVEAVVERVGVPEDETPAVLELIAANPPATSPPA